MNRMLTIELSEGAYAALERRAQAAAQSPAGLAAAALEQRFGSESHATSEADSHAARLRFERHFGAVDLGHATGTNNDAIDADLERSYGDDHGQA